MHEQDKIRHGTELDDVISAEIPDREDDPLLHRLVTERMLHTCNDSCRPPDQPNLALLDQNGLPVERCLKGFPQPFSDHTVITERNLPVYLRRQTGIVHQIGQKVYDNKYVVPYNPYLLKHFQSHINVEYIAYASSMKYLFKYVTKGNDQARVYATVAPGHGNMNVANPPAPANNQQPPPQPQVNYQPPPLAQQQPIQAAPIPLPLNSQANNQPAQQQPAVVPANQAPPLRNSQAAMPPPPPPAPAPNDNNQAQNNQPPDRANRVIYNEIEDYISK